MQSKLSKEIRIIFIGDVIGKFGRRMLENTLLPIKRKYKPGIIIVNGENSAGGIGIVKKTAFEMYNAGVDIITTGNHVWDKKEALDLIKNDDHILRPMNYPKSVPGKGYIDFKTKDGTSVLVINLQGRVFMEPVVDNPFTIIDDFLKKSDFKVIFMDFHAEATAEKQAMGFFLDGRVSAVLGTHTHVQTNDLRILTNGTAYQTDVGMTGSIDSVIGMKKEPIITKFLTGINQRFEVAKKDMILDMAVVDINKLSGKATRVESVRLHESTYEKQLHI